MAALDWICVVVLLASLVIGAVRGLIYELLSLASWVVAFFLAQWFATAMGEWLPMREFDPMWRQTAGFVVVFVLALFACSFVAWVTKRLIEAIGLRPADRALGALFGVLRGGVLLLVVALIVLWTPLHEGAWWQESISAGWLTAALQMVKPLLSPDMAQHVPV